MEVHLVYRDDSLGNAWREHFSQQPAVLIVGGDITATACDAVVSPANSFGFMDGGLDAALSDRFGWDLQTSLQQQVREQPERELLIGRALVLPTGDAMLRWLIVAPTMRVPMSFNIATSINAYLAMKAILIAAQHHPQINSVAIPGLCTGVGRLPPTIAARQMFAAYDEVVLENRLAFADFGEAQKHHLDLNPNGMIWDF